MISNFLPLWGKSILTLILCFLLNNSSINVLSFGFLLTKIFVAGTFLS